MFKRILSCLAAAAIGFCSSVSAFAYTQTVTEKSCVPPKIVFLGDSIAAGYGLDGYSSDNLYACDSYANLMGKEYKKELEGKCNAQMVNKAVSGEASYDLLEHLNKGDFDYALKDSQSVVISTGANDIIKVLIMDIVKDLGYDSKVGRDSIKVTPLAVAKILKDIYALSDEVDKALENYSKNINSIIDYINRKTNAVIIVQTVYNPMEYLGKYNIISDYSKEKLENLNKRINEESKGGKRYLVCDIAPLFEGKTKELTNMSENDIHPNSKGHKIIAEKIDKLVRTKTYTYTKTIEIPDKNLDLNNTENEKNNVGITMVIISSVFVGGGILIFVVRVVISAKKKSSQKD